MDQQQYLNELPFPACTLNPDGIVTGANPLIKNVFLYEDIVGYNFFTIAGFKRDQLMSANDEEMILERNGKLFKLWINEDAKEDEDIVVFFDEATARESFRTKLESEKAVIVYINIDNYDELMDSANGSQKNFLISRIESALEKAFVTESDGFFRKIEKCTY
jgi:c-di-AMP phosphodiesterase-like protein